MHLSLFLGSVVDDFGAENGPHEIVHFLLREHVVIGFEKHRLGFWSEKEGKSLEKYLTRPALAVNNFQKLIMKINCRFVRKKSAKIRKIIKKMLGTK